MTTPMTAAMRTTMRMAGPKPPRAPAPVAPTRAMPHTPPSLQITVCTHMRPTPCPRLARESPSTHQRVPAPKWIAQRFPRTHHVVVDVCVVQHVDGEVGVVEAPDDRRRDVAAYGVVVVGAGAVRVWVRVRVAGGFAAHLFGSVLACSEQRGWYWMYLLALLCSASDLQIYGVVSCVALSYLDLDLRCRNGGWKRE